MFTQLGSNGKQLYLENVSQRHKSVEKGTVSFTVHTAPRYTSPQTDSTDHSAVFSNENRNKGIAEDSYAFSS